ncbi:heme biosynthesis protein HemY [Pukyongiella litopenaei]|uniref:Tetratricopeptide repeat protein n=1 Tax=Pukyongiella litopenaei TaxID=2605946 RepID=A0A2S0MNA1_9RHOB|nr:heme biosynthesis HemY N-terminal domain-containing protein [Pukyongiella litopenaei]AVO37193.1 tetratricopeptide repeat protein [Pukyongiella litopenaei]
MLWSLVKILVFIALVAALAVGAGYLLESDGGVQVTMAGTEYTLGPLQSVIAVLVLVLALWLGLKLLSLLVAVLKFLNGDETALSRYFDRNREKRGYKALSDGLMALASGEGRLALAKAAKAEKYLDDPELTNLLIAQAAEMAGDTRKATETYKKLIVSDATRFVGVRGVMKQKLAQGDTDTARKLAEKALALKPKHEEVQDVLLKLQAQAGDWKGARGTLSTKLRSGSMPRDLYRRRDAVLALSEARDILNEDAAIEDVEEAITANKLSPDLVPAAALAARTYVARGKKRNAVRVLKRAWEAQPHPDLAAAFAEIEPDETPAARVKRFGALTHIHPQNPETRLLLAELNVVAEDFPEARRALGDLADSSGDVRALTLMAAIERGEGASDAVVHGWLARAYAAPRGPQWVCDNCQHVHATWAPVCESCEGFDTLSWKVPVVPDAPSATGIEMLPLIVGKPAEIAAEISDDNGDMVDSAPADAALAGETAAEAATETDNTSPDAEDDRLKNTVDAVRNLNGSVETRGS